MFVVLCVQIICYMLRLRVLARQAGKHEKARRYLDPSRLAQPRGGFRGGRLYTSRCVCVFESIIVIISSGSSSRSSRSSCSTSSTSSTFIIICLFVCFWLKPSLGSGGPPGGGRRAASAPAATPGPPLIFYYVSYYIVSCIVLCYIILNDSRLCYVISYYIM